MTPDEAFNIAATLNACSTIVTKWATGGSLPVVGKPDREASYIVPVTPIMQLEWETNERECKK